MTSLYLIFHGRFPSEKAASLFAALSANAFSKQGRRVVLLVPRRAGVPADAHAFYGLPPEVAVMHLPVVDLFGPPLARSLAFWASFVSFSLQVRAYLKAHAGPRDIIYSNESLPLWMAARDFPRTAFEMHDFPESKLRLFSRFIRRMDKVIIHNAWKTRAAIERFGLDPERVLVELNAVDVNAFDPALSRAEARERLGIPAHDRVVAYTGHLYRWKGVDTLLEAAGMLPECSFVLVGGTPDAVAEYRERYASPRVRFEGFRPHEEIPLWQRAADVLVIPNTAREAISAYYTSPMKLFEYMASGTPVVASRLPSIEEIVDGSMVTFAEPDDPDSFRDAIAAVFDDPEAARKKAAIARAAVATHTWDARAARILAFLDAGG
jgi:glycosyltransferase involved in cell wall biosynthesis